MKGLWNVFCVGVVLFLAISFGVMAVAADASDVKGEWLGYPVDTGYPIEPTLPPDITVHRIGAQPPVEVKVIAIDVSEVVAVDVAIEPDIIDEPAPLSMPAIIKPITARLMSGYSLFVR